MAGRAHAKLQCCPAFLGHVTQRRWLQLNAGSASVVPDAVRLRSGRSHHLRCNNNYTTCPKSLLARSRAACSQVAAAQTLEEIHGALVAACNNLESLGMFNRIEALISEEPLEEPDACSVSIDLEEKKFYAAKIGTHVQVSAERISSALCAYIRAAGIC